MTLDNIKTTALRVLVTFVGAFAMALPLAAADWNVSVLEKAAVAGLVAAAELIQSVVTAVLTGQPQITPAGRTAAKTRANG